MLWDDAIARAKYLDSLPEPKGKLFGLPISTKEYHGGVGPNITTSASFVAWAGTKHGPNLLYNTFWDEGCVFFARTTQPQAILHLETVSTLYGRTVHPQNRLLTPGGSSGGESALVGMRGSIMVSGLSLFSILSQYANYQRALGVILEVAFEILVHMLASMASSMFRLRYTNLAQDILLSMLTVWTIDRVPNESVQWVIEL